MSQKPEIPNGDGIRRDQSSGIPGGNVPAHANA